MGKSINISVDPGYDGTKVFINGCAYRYDSVVVSDKNQTLRKDGYGQGGVNSRIVVYKDDVTYIVGEHALRMEDVSDAIENDSAVNDSLDIPGSARFASENFAILVNAAIVSSLIRASKEGAVRLDDDRNFTVNLVMAIPHAYYESSWQGIVDSFLGKTVSFEIEIGDSGRRSVTLTFQHVITVSQALLTLCGYAANDDGTFKEDFDDSYYPTLLVDCGYGTIGICFVGKGGYVSEKAESNTRLAMKAVNVAVSEKLREMGIARSYSEVERLCVNPQDAVIRETERVDGEWKVRTVDVAGIHKETLDSVVDELVDYLFREYDLGRKKSVLVSGGTGAKYFPGLQKKICKTGVLTEDRVILTEATYGKKTYPSIYTVAIGGLKFLEGMDFGE